MKQRPETVSRKVPKTIGNQRVSIAGASVLMNAAEAAPPVFNISVYYRPIRLMREK
jgi:hypothetical protein